MTSEGVRSRAWPAIFLTPALLWTLTACPAADSDPEGPTTVTTAPSTNEPSENEDLAQSLGSAVEDLAGVERATATWQDRFEVPETLSVTVGVTPDADFDSVFDEVVRLAWTSEISPLSTLTLYGSDVTDAQRNDQRNVFFDDGDTARDLEERYGPRPN